MKRLLITSLSLITLLLAAACVPMAPAPAAEAPAEATAAPAEESAEEALDIVDTAVGAGNFTTLVAAVEAAGLVETLKGEGPFTVFAPTDEAFAALPAGTIDALLADPTGDLTQILLYHVVPGAVMAADVTDGMTATTVQGGDLTFTVSDGTVKVNDATVVTADIVASNGVIHVIDTVILPPADAEVSDSAAMTETTGMTETMPMTGTETMTETSEGAMLDIVDTAVGAGNFTTLVAAVEAAGLVETLKGEGPFTVFAPTDEAFAALPAGTIDALLADPAGDLTQILLYHVVPGAVMAADVTDGLEAVTVQGAPVLFSVADGVVKINDATIVATDIQASNGVIHVIDAVILPPTQ